jgi:hypothetical protein
LIVALSNPVEVSAVYQFEAMVPSPGVIFLSIDFGVVLSHAGQALAKTVSYVVEPSVSIRLF